jgi:hypothetical protein
VLAGLQQLVQRRSVDGVPAHRHDFQLYKVSILHNYIYITYRCKAGTHVHDSPHGVYSVGRSQCPVQREQHDTGESEDLQHRVLREESAVRAQVAVRLE